MMSEREKVILNNTVNLLVSYFDPGKIILFGSRAKGINKKYSDFDFAVDTIKPNFKIQKKLTTEIEKYSGLYSVDIIYLNNVSKEFKKIIFNTGKVVYERRI